MSSTNLTAALLPLLSDTTTISSKSPSASKSGDSISISIRCGIYYHSNSIANKLIATLSVRRFSQRKISIRNGQAGDENVIQTQTHMFQLLDQRSVMNGSDSA